jgi:hypothetical protein
MPAPYIRPHETLDRIDFIFSGGPAATLDSRVFGEAGGSGVDASVTPWPSDHRAVVSTFEVLPVAAPAIIAVEPAVVHVGAEFHVRGFDPAAEGWTVAVVNAGSPPTPALRFAHEDITAWRRFARFSSQGLAMGEYDAVLLDEKQRELKRARFAIIDSNQPPQLDVRVATNSSRSRKPKQANSVAEQSAPGQPIQVRWQNMPGHRFDWVGLFKLEPKGSETLVSQTYLQGRTLGTLELPNFNDSKPLPAGRYEVRLMLDDSPTVLATAPVALR